LSNNEWAVPRKGGAESRENNVIYIGRASFRMEPAPLTAEEMVTPIAAPFAALNLGTAGVDAPHATGEDVEPPYLRLRTLVDETLGKETQASPYPPDLDLTEFATLAENTGVEVVGRNAPSLPHALIADVASFPHAMPTMTSFAAATDVVVPGKRRLSFSRTRLVGWGAVAFCAGVLASAGAHMVAAPARLGPTANAATPTASRDLPSAPSPAAPAAAAPAPAASIAVVPVPAVPAHEAEATAPDSPAPESARADASHLALAANSAAVRTRSGASGQPRGQTRARGRMRSRSSSAFAAEIAGETDAPSSDAPATEAAPAPAARPAHPSAGWVDPFAQSAHATDGGAHDEAPWRRLSRGAFTKLYNWATGETCSTSSLVGSPR